MIRKFSVLLLGIAITAPGLSLTGQAQNVSSTFRRLSAKRRSWVRMMKHTRLPKNGCFRTSYPDTTWKETPCTTAPNMPVVPRHGSGTQAAGNGNDFAAEITSGLISSVNGSFNGSGVTSENGYIDNSPPAYSNSFSLQLNSNFFANPPACSGAANPSICQGWQQFVVEESNGGNATLFMQYWLVDYDTNCPGGWTSYGSDCYRNSSATGIPSFSASSIPDTGVTGEAENGTDTALFIMDNPTEIYSVSQADNVLDLEQYWTQAEFNVFGDGNGGEANFNGGSTFLVETSLDSGSGTSLVCVGPQLRGSTAETNNLTLLPQSSPACCSYGGDIQFAESNTSGVGASCGAGGLQLEGNFTATPTSANGKETVITHPIIQGEVRIQYSATLEDGTSGSTINYQLFNSCGQLLTSGSVSPGTNIGYLNTEIDGQTCTYGVHGTMYAAAPGEAQSLTNVITF